MVNKTSGLRKRTLDQVKVISIKNGEVVVVRRWEGFTDADQESITNALKKKLYKHDGVVLLFVDKLSDVRTLNEQQMKKYRWKKF